MPGRTDHVNSRLLCSVNQRYNLKAIHNYQEFIFSERRFRLLSKNAGWMNPHLLSFVSPNEMTSKKSGVFCG